MKQRAIPAGMSIGRAVGWLAIAVVIGGWVAPVRVQSDETRVLPFGEGVGGRY